MDLGINGCKVLITGSTYGIGKGIATMLLKEGCSVTVTGRSQEKLQQAVDDLFVVAEKQRIQGFTCDFTNDAEVAYLADQIKCSWGHLDILVCNVGSGKSVSPLNETSQEWRKVVDTNLFTATSAVQHCLPLLKRSSKPSIVLISSICGVEALGAPVTYSVAKSGLIALAANWANPLGRLGIRINVVSPGNIMFPGSVWEEKKDTSLEQVEEMLKKEVPLGRFGSMDDIAAAVAFLSSPRAAFITGTNLIIDGGQTRNI